MPFPFPPHLSPLCRLLRHDSTLSSRHLLDGQAIQEVNKPPSLPAQRGCANQLLSLIVLIFSVRPSPSDIISLIDNAQSFVRLHTTFDLALNDGASWQEPGYIRFIFCPLGVYLLLPTLTFDCRISSLLLVSRPIGCRRFTSVLHPDRLAASP